MDVFLITLSFPKMLADADTGSADPLAIIVGVLVLVCLGLCAALKSAHSTAKGLGKDADRLTKRIYDLEQELKQATSKRQFRIMHVDDEGWFLGIVATAIERKFENVNVSIFFNDEETQEQLLSLDPDLLILRDYATELLSLLSKRKARFAILVLSRCATEDEFEAKIKQLGCSDLNVSFLSQPFDGWEAGVADDWLKQQLCPEVSKYIQGKS